MTTLDTASRPLVVVLTAALLVALAASGAAAQTPGGTEADRAAAVEADPQVREAVEGVEAARERLARLSAHLDTVAAQFEATRAHVLRLEEELADADRVVEAVEDEVAAARTRFEAGVRQAYMFPGLDLLRTSGAFLLAADAPTALHGSAVMAQVAQAQAAALRSVRRAGGLAVDDIAQQSVIAAGAAGAQADLEAFAAELTAALDVAAAELGLAEEALATAREEAEARAAAAEQAAAMQGLVVGADGTVGFAGAFAAFASPVVVVSGWAGGAAQEMTCPVARPNAFVDSWVAPRSGGRLHQGVDMFAAHGLPVFAVADGVVTRVWNNQLGGLSVNLVDGLGNRYYYAHLSAAYVLEGQQVRVGAPLGAVGNSGNARYTPSHLHWQFHPGGGGPVNPTPLASALCR